MISTRMSCLTNEKTQTHAYVHLFVFTPSRMITQLRDILIKIELRKSMRITLSFVGLETIKERSGLATEVRN